MERGGVTQLLRVQVDRRLQELREESDSHLLKSLNNAKEFLDFLVPPAVASSVQPITAVRVRVLMFSLTCSEY